MFEEFKKLADRKKEIFDEDIDSLVKHLFEEAQVPKTWDLVSLQVTAGTNVTETAAVRLRNTQTGEEAIDVAIGDGPIDAAFLAIMKITGVDATLKHYDLKAVTGGKDAIGEVHLELKVGGRSYKGRGRSTDVIEASVLAFLNALNRAVTAGEPAEADSP